MVEIFSLGHLALRTNPKSIATAIKRNSQPTALLQLLITAGPQGIDKTEAEFKLWPQAQAAIADNTLDTTLYRLRKMLGNSLAIELANGIVRLNDAYVRVDAWEFSAEGEAFCARLQSPSRVLDATEISAHCERLFDLYKGHFLAKEQATPWIVQMRDTLQAKFFRVIKLAGGHLQAMQEWGHATQWYERALELDNLAEEIHRELMHCHFARGEFADVVRVFRRCRELFSLVLGVMPSAATEKVYRLALAGKS